MKLETLFWKLTAGMVLCTAAFGATEEPEVDNPDLRLRLGDAVQERRTTPLNWDDLKTVPETRGPIPKKRVELLAMPKFRVFLDAGHGGKDRGAQGPKGLSEHAISLRIARLMKQSLSKKWKNKVTELEVKLSRDKDEFIPLTKRADAANAWEADVFVSVHANWSNFSKAKGFEVYFLSNDASDEAAMRLAKLENRGEKKSLSPVESILDDSRASLHIFESSRLAEMLFHAMTKTVKSNVHGVRQAPFSVLAGTTMPAVLVEVGYISHPIDARLLTKESYLKQLADAISSGIVAYATGVRKLT